MTTEQMAILAVWMACSLYWHITNDHAITRLKEEIAGLRETYWFIQNDKTINQLKKEIAELSETPVEKALSRTGEQ